MLIPIETLRVRIGLDSADNSRDDELTLYYQIALAIIETYCNRKFEWQADVEKFTHKAGYGLSLRRYPLTEITAINGDENNTAIRFHAHDESGVIEFDGYVISHVVTVEYEGGFTELNVPADLKWCILQGFDLINQGETGNELTGAIVKSIASDGANIQYDLSASIGTAKALDLVSGLPSNTVAILDNYRRILC